jgi:hypothetical protein
MGHHQAEYPVLGKVSIGPTMMIRTPASPAPVLAIAANTPQSHANPAIEFGEGRAVAVLIVLEPAPQRTVGVVAGSLAVVLRTGTRLKRVADVLSMHWKWCGLDVAAASCYSLRLWPLRLGRYQLSRPKVQADDWMWIMDHTMQLGKRKCLIVVGLRQSAWNARDRILSHEDVELIDLVPVTESNGKVVYRQLQAAVAQTGVPRAIVSDGGSDLHAGIERFCQAHPRTVWLYDIKHKTACLLKHALDRDASWKESPPRCCTTRARRMFSEV